VFIVVKIASIEYHRRWHSVLRDSAFRNPPVFSVASKPRMIGVITKSAKRLEKTKRRRQNPDLYL